MTTAQQYRYFLLLIVAALAGCFQAEPPCRVHFSSVTTVGDPSAQCEPVTCGNGVVDPGEACDIGAESNGNDGLAAGTTYDEWNCDVSCRRLRVFTPCSAGCDSGDAYCDAANTEAASMCHPKCTWDRAFSNLPGPADRHDCSFSNGRVGLCLATDNCIPVCDSDADCPNGKPCIMIGSSKLCNM